MDYTFDSFLRDTYDWDPAARVHTAPWIIYDIYSGSSRTAEEDIDRIFAEHPGADTVKVSGLTQQSFEYLIGTYGAQLRAIDFFKNKLIEDWSVLGALQRLEYVKFFLNQRIDRFWDMSNNLSLKGLSVCDFSRLKDVELVNTAPVLETFKIGNKVSSCAVIDSFKPLAGSHIKRLCFCGKDVTDKDLTFLDGLPELERYDFPTNLYTTEQVAWIAANYPGLSGFAIAPYTGYPTEKEPEGGGWVVGKRKPYLVYKGNEERINRYEKAFETMKRKIKGIPYGELFNGND